MWRLSNRRSRKPYDALTAVHRRRLDKLERKARRLREEDSVNVDRTRADSEAVELNNVYVDGNR